MTDDNHSKPIEDMTLSDIRMFGDWVFGLRVFMVFFLMILLMDMGTDLMTLLHVSNNPEAGPIDAPFGMNPQAHMAFILTFLCVASLSVKLTMESLFSPLGTAIFKPDSTTPLSEYEGIFRSFGELRFEVKAYLIGFPMTLLVPLGVQLMTGQ